MKPTPFTLTAWTVRLLVALTGPSTAQAGDATVHPLGDHPAVVVQRLHQRAGYDYASKFYPHPAWLWLRAEAPAQAASDVGLAGDPRVAAAAPGERPGSPAVAQLSATPR